jgi:hypothetical protein
LMSARAPLWPRTLGLVPPFDARIIGLSELDK